MAIITEIGVRKVCAFQGKGIWVLYSRKLSDDNKTADFENKENRKCLEMLWKDGQRRLLRGRHWVCS